MDKPKFIQILEGEIGVEEPEAEKYFEATDYGEPDEDTPYCAACLCWCLEKSGLKSPHSAAAMSFMSWGKPVEEGTLYAIVVFRWRNGGHHVSTWHGDGFLGGNQTGDHEVCIEDLPWSRAIAWRMPLGV